MPQIYSGRKKDQLYNAIGNRLVRRSNALEDDYTGDVHPELRRVINKMHAAGLLDGLAAMYGPDGYGITAPNRIHTVREIVPGSGDAVQETAGARPYISQASPRMNLALSSIYPGSLGANNPTGWSTAAVGTEVPHGEVVASDDPSNDHQAWEVPALTEQRRFLHQGVPVVEGVRYVVAVRVEANGYVSGNSRAFGSTVTPITSEEERTFNQVAVGEWAYLAFTANASGSLSLRCGPGSSGTTTTSGPTRLSRPMLIYRPVDWGARSEHDRQEYLSNHYAATAGADPVHPGRGDVRTSWFLAEGHLMAPALNGVFDRLSSGVSLSFLFRFLPDVQEEDWYSLCGTVNDGSSNAFSAEVGTGADKFRLHVRGNSGQYIGVADGIPSLTDGRWHFMTIVPRLDGYWLFVDGDGGFHAFTAIGDDFSAVDYDMSIGARNLRGVFDRVVGGSIESVIKHDLALDLESHKKLKDIILPSPEWDYTIVVIPDTQYLAEDLPQHFEAMTDWIVENQETMKIEAVLHVGDVTHRQQAESTSATPYENIATDLDRLFGMDTPFVACIGNHDYTNGFTGSVDDDRESVALWNQYLGPARYPDGVFMDSGTSVNMYVVREIGGRPTMILTLEFFPRAAVMAWADTVISANPALDVIVITHAYLTRGGTHYEDADTFGPDHYLITDATNGADMWAEHFSQHGNVIAVFSGHDLGDRRVSYRVDEGSGGRLAYQQYANWQNADEGGKGRVVVLHVNAAAGTAFRRIYNPVDARWEDEWGVENIPWPES